MAVLGTLLQLCLGTVYAWSYFQGLLVAGYGWTHTAVALVFSTAIFFLGLAAAAGGTLLPRHGPRKLAVLGGLLFGAGYLVSAAALQMKWLPGLYLGYGLAGGIGLGLGYVTPVATVARWFPDRKGLATGMVVMGFGFGALLMSKVLAPGLMNLMDGSLPGVFACLGVTLGGAAAVSGGFLRNPPAAGDPARRQPGVDPGVASPVAWRKDRQAHDILSGRFALMWLVFFANISAGIAIIGFQSPLLQDILRRGNPQSQAEQFAAAGATLIAVSSLFNGIGRLFWGSVSDRIGRVRTFRVMLVTQIAAFALLARVANPWLFGALICYVLLCYGGGFGAMPSFVADVFGAKKMGRVYGAILTAWSAAGIAGPPALAALKDRLPEQQAALCAFMAAIAVLAVGFALSLRLGSAPDTAATGRITG